MMVLSLTSSEISKSCDWETVKNVIMGNSSSKPDQTWPFLTQKAKWIFPSLLLVRVIYNFRVVEWIFISFVLNSNNYYKELLKTLVCQHNLWPMIRVGTI